MTMTIWWPRSGVWIYQIVTGMTSVVGVPSTHLVSRISTFIFYDITLMWVLQHPIDYNSTLFQVMVWTRTYLSYIFNTNAADVLSAVLLAVQVESIPHKLIDDRCLFENIVNIIVQFMHFTVATVLLWKYEDLICVSLQNTCSTFKAGWHMICVCIAVFQQVHLCNVLLNIKTS